MQGFETGVIERLGTLCGGGFTQCFKQVGALVEQFQQAFTAQLRVLRLVLGVGGEQQALCGT